MGAGTRLIAEESEPNSAPNVVDAIGVPKLQEPPRSAVPGEALARRTEVFRIEAIAVVHHNEREAAMAGKTGISIIARLGNIAVTTDVATALTTGRAMTGIGAITATGGSTVDIVYPSDTDTTRCTAAMVCIAIVCES